MAIFWPPEEYPHQPRRLVGGLLPPPTPPGPWRSPYAVLPLELFDAPVEAPQQRHAGVAALPVIATTILFSGPSWGLPGLASGTFKVALPAGQIVTTNIILNISDGGAGGTFTPPHPGLSSYTPGASATFTYTPAGVALITITPTASLPLTPLTIGFDAGYPRRRHHPW